ncbi:MAG: DUF6088 family protein [Oscillospiraceae bacterium]|jgi:hypothetical protein|nr:DUF6088 family protein [Oscillospiraceae bacterium]
MSRPNYLNEIKARIQASDKGSVFVATDFADITDVAKVGVCLSRLEAEGLIRRVMRGVYDYPEYNRLLDEYVAPSADKVAHAIARNFGWTIVPCGDTVLNILELSIQVPTIWLYVSDGTYKEYSFDNTTIKFKRTTNKDISGMSYKTALIIQALKALGKEHIDGGVLDKLSRKLSAKEKKQMTAEAKSATSWVYEIHQEALRGKRRRQKIGKR